MIKSVFEIEKVANTNARSKTHSEFISIRDRILQDAQHNFAVFTKRDVSRLPRSVVNYFYYCGYIGAPKMYAMKAVYQDVRFLFGKGKPITIDYVQYNIAYEPARIAYIDSCLLGIPFEGLDLYISGSGSMKGILANLITLFNQRGEALDKSGLATFLSECLIIPTVALQDYITWEEIDALHAKATMSYYGNSASGIFSFSENGQMISFDTYDREAAAINGSRRKARWSAVFSDYRLENGVNRPSRFQAIWRYDDGDLIYFDGENVSIEFNPNPSPQNAIAGGKC